LQLWQHIFKGRDNHFGGKFKRVFGQLRNIAAAAQSHHLIGGWVAPQKIQSILPDGARGAED